MRAIRAAAVACIALTAACGRESVGTAEGPAAAPAPDSAAPERISASYLCGETTARLTFAGDRAELTIDGREGAIALSAAPSASGARYVGDGAEFHVKGDRARLTLAGVEAPECVELAGAAADESDVQIFRARGNEPGWSLALGPDRYTFTADYGDKIASGRSPAPQADGDDLIYASAEHELEIRISNIPCTDDATGMPYPKTVTAAFDGATYSGCGGAPQELLIGDWRLVEIAGAPAPEGLEATMSFSADGRVAGRAACNRYSADWTLSGEGLSIGPAAATKMACVDPAGSQTEQRFFEVLPSTDRFAVDADGTLILFAADQPILKARR